MALSSALTGHPPAMMISKLREHFPARTPEWANALTLFAWGTYILWHPGLFQQPYFAGLYHMGLAWSESPERFWGWLTVTVGMIRACALFVNGAYSRTPLVRLCAAAISAFIWSQVMNGIMTTGMAAPSLVMYASALFLDLISAYRASCDLVIADATRRAAMRDALRSRGVNGFASSARSGIGATVHPNGG